MSKFFDECLIGSNIIVDCKYGKTKAKVIGHIIETSNKRESLLVYSTNPNITFFTLVEHHIDIFFSSKHYDIETVANISDYIDKSVRFVERSQVLMDYPCSRYDEIVKN